MAAGLINDGSFTEAVALLDEILPDIRRLAKPSRTALMFMGLGIALRPLAGNRTLNVVPLPGRLTTSIAPLCPRTIPWTRDRTTLQRAPYGTEM